MLQLLLVDKLTTTAMFIKELKNFGLTQNEAKIYLAALGLGATLASTLSRKTGINRASIYAVGAGLVKKGLMNVIKRNKTYFFYSLEPQKMLDACREMIQKQETVYRNLCLIVPELEQMMKKTYENRPQIECLEGRHNLETMYKAISSQKNSELCSFMNARNATRFLKNIDNVLHRILLPKDDSFPPKFSHVEDIEIKHLSEPCFVFDSMIHLHNQKVIFVDDGEVPTGIVIENNAIYRTMKNLFDSQWKNAR